MLVLLYPVFLHRFCCFVGRRRRRHVLCLWSPLVSRRGRGCVEVGRLLACGSLQGIVALFKDTTRVGMHASLFTVSFRRQVSDIFAGPCIRALLPPFRTWKPSSFRTRSCSVRSHGRNWLYSILVGHPLIRNQAGQVEQTRCQPSGRTDPEQQESFPAIVN